MRRFNVTGLCVPEEDYMVDISGKIEKIRKLVDGRCYFTINRARQYGKTTTLACLEKALMDDYLVASISFEGIGDESFASPESFCPVFLERIARALGFANAPKEYSEGWKNDTITDFSLFDKHITKMCRDKRVVLMIDEVDKSCNHRLFLNFLSLLRDKFLARKNRKDHTFYSVILAGVYDVKNIKLKMINEGLYKPSQEENKLYNSPWNIAVNFDVDMSFNPAEIATMLDSYEEEHNTGMDIAAIADGIYEFTSGYPFLVSRICQLIDEKLDRKWTTGGIREAVDIILMEKNTLFDDMFKNLEAYTGLYDFMYAVLISGEKKNFIIDDPNVNIGVMFGLIKSFGERVMVANRIFEIRMSNYFISKESNLNPEKQINSVLRQDVVRDERFDMELCLKKFAEHYAELYNENDAGFFEKHGRILFLSYLKPLINGQGFYHIESQFTDQRRMDIVVDFGREQFVIELKLWKGEAAHQDAYAQLAGYLDSRNVGTGWLLTFDFRKKIPKQPRAEWVEYEGKRIFDVVA
ncbi:MAG: AAA-like domain-containing protein [Lachnospiraceae bacterium]|jgi:hypothetical protein|nr:AAA-like domain-containing protein [Lachnospiraceae bacterium]